MFQSNHTSALVTTISYYWVPYLSLVTTSLLSTKIEYFRGEVMTSPVEVGRLFYAIFNTTLKNHYTLSSTTDGHMAQSILKYISIIDHITPFIGSSFSIIESRRKPLQLIKKRTVEIFTKQPHKTCLTGDVLFC